MNEYHKIQTVFKRDEKTNFKTLLIGVFAVKAFEYLRYNKWIFTEKVDGTNIRIKYENGAISYAGKTDRAQLSADLVNILNLHLLPLVGTFKEIFGDTPACLYGEGYGAGIQKGGIYRPDKNFVLFDVFINGIWLQREDVEDIGYKLVIDAVPDVGCGTLEDMVGKVQAGFKSMWGDFDAEGIVARPETELMSRDGKRIITKIKAKDFK